MSDLFRPAWWMRNAHLQTIWPTFCRRPIKEVKPIRERFELPDGDFLDLDWVGEGKGPIILLLHGLEGSSRSPYAQGMLWAIQQRGWRGVLLHFRGCSGENNRHARSYHSGDTGDLAIVLQAIHERYPHTSLAAIGFSLGGNVLLKWLGERGKDCLLKTAVAISVPYELHKSSKKLQSGLSRLYQRHFMRLLCEKIGKKFLSQRAPFELPHLKELKTLWDFDDEVTAPLHGFIDANDYYTRSSCRPFLANIQVPTLLLHAKDDPFMTQDTLPLQQELSAHVMLELSEKGGHVGFINGIFPWRANYWLEQRTPLFLEKHL